MGRKLRRKATQENIMELGRTETKGAERKVVRRKEQRILGRMQNNRRMEKIIYHRETQIAFFA
jgi:hypothetical protein